MKKLKIVILVSVLIGLLALGFAVFNDKIPSASEGSKSKETASTVPSGEVEDTIQEHIDKSMSSIEFEDEQDEEEKQKEPATNGRVVCIDAGHQQKANMNKEPIGPGSSKKKAKVDGGTQGKYTGLKEYQLNLDIALKLQAELESRGYTVVMVRVTNDVDISNSERAAIANEAKAEAFVKIHGDGSDIASAQGATSLCQTKGNPYNGNLYEQSRALAECVLDGVSASTGCKKRPIIETDKMTGINWSNVPTTIIEVGYLTNKEEEAKLATDEYQTKVAKGIADGVDQFFDMQ